MNAKFMILATMFIFRTIFVTMHSLCRQWSDPSLHGPLPFPLPVLFLHQIWEKLKVFNSLHHSPGLNLQGSFWLLLCLSFSIDSVLHIVWSCWGYMELSFFHLCFICVHFDLMCLTKTSLQLSVCDDPMNFPSFSSLFPPPLSISRTFSDFLSPEV